MTRISPRATLALSLGLSAVLWALIFTAAHAQMHPIESPQGQQGEPGPVGPAGPPGKDSTVPGPQGPPGANATMGPGTTYRAGSAQIDFGVAGDHAISLTGPPQGGDWIIQHILVYACNKSMQTARGAFYAYPGAVNLIAGASYAAITNFSGIDQPYTAYGEFSPTWATTPSDQNIGSISQSTSFHFGAYGSGQATIYLNIATPQPGASCGVEVIGMGL